MMGIVVRLLGGGLSGGGEEKGSSFSATDVGNNVSCRRGKGKAYGDLCFLGVAEVLCRE